jgi:Meiotically up-regulated gene 113
MGAIRLKYLSVERSRHGRQVCYVISGTAPRRRIRIREELDSPGFMAAYHAAVAALKNDGGGDFGKVEGFVYFIVHGVGNSAKVKIGTSRNVRARLADLKTGVPGTARVYYVTPGNTGLERELHRKFAEDRISGEWFQFSSVIRDWIKKDRDRRAHERGWSTRIIPFQTLAPQKIRSHL